MPKASRLLTIVETPEFLRRAAEIGMTARERAALIDALARDPTAGVALGGGLRKLRVARTGGGKSGGYRVLHFYRGDATPLFLLSVFAKNERANITPEEKSALIAICDEIAGTYGRR